MRLVGGDHARVVALRPGPRRDRRRRAQGRRRRLGGSGALGRCRPSRSTASPRTSSRRSSAPCSSGRPGGTSFVLAGSLPPAAAEAAARAAEVSDALPVEARGLVKRYGEIVAVDHVDLTVERGDVFGYLGPNGAGKTTSLRMLLGLIRPTARLGAAVRPRPARRRREGARRRRRLRRGPALLPVPLRAGGTSSCSPTTTSPSPAARIDEVLELVELRDRAKDRVGGYSHGMRQRLGIARRAPAPAAAAAARRADHRPRPGRHARHARPRPPPRRRGDHDPALEPPAQRGRGALQPRRDHPQGPRSSTRARSATCSRPRRAATACARSSPSGRAPRCLAQPGIDRRRAARRRAALHRPTRTPSRRSPSRSARRGSAFTALVPETASLEELFLGMTGGESSDHDRGRGGRRMTARRARLPLGAREAARAEADVPRARRGDARADHLRRRARHSRPAARTTSRSAATSATPGSRCRSSSSSSCRSGACR